MHVYPLTRAHIRILFKLLYNISHLRTCDALEN